MKEAESGMVFLRRALRRRLGLLLSVTLVAMIISAVVSLLLPPVYESSLVLEIGEIFIPPAENIKVEAQTIEEPMSAALVLGSLDFLSQTRDKLGMQIPLDNMAERLVVEQIVETTRFQRMESPLIKLTYEGSDPAFNVKILQYLADLLINEHAGEYSSSIKMLRSRIKNLESKISDSERLIERLENYRKGLGETIGLVEEGIRDYSEQLSELDFAATQQTEALFLKSTLNSMKEQIIEMRKSGNEAVISIGEEQEKIQVCRDGISNLNNLIELSRNTVIRANAVVSEEPIRPKVFLNTLIAGILALLLGFFFVLFQEYSRPNAS